MDLARPKRHRSGRVGHGGGKAHGSPVDETEAELLVEQAAAIRKRMAADRLARWLGVTYRQRELLWRRPTIGCVDVGRTARRELRKRKARLREEKRRRAAGVQPRREYEANSLSAMRPWEQLQMSRRSYYRHQKAIVGTTPCASIFLHLGNRPVPERKGLATTAPRIRG
jgi:hypothetical protein